MIAFIPTISLSVGIRRVVFMKDPTLYHTERAEQPSRRSPRAEEPEGVGALIDGVDPREPDAGDDQESAAKPRTRTGEGERRPEKRQDRGAVREPFRDRRVFRPEGRDPHRRDGDRDARFSEFHTPVLPPVSTRGAGLWPNRAGWQRRRSEPRRPGAPRRS